MAEIDRNRKSEKVRRILAELEAVHASGMVSSGGVPVGGAGVVLVAESGRTVTAATDESGEFRFAGDIGLSAGQYQISVIRPDDDQALITSMPVELEAGAGLRTFLKIDHEAEPTF